MEKSNYRIAYDKGWQDLAQKDPLDVAASMKVEYNTQTQQFLVPLLNENYLVDLRQKTIRRQTDSQVPEIDAAILILHYLSFFEHNAEVAGKWVSLKEIPNGGMLFYPAFQKQVICGLTQAFGSNPAALLTCAARLGGQPARFGDASAIFQVFPKTPLCAAVWEGDEEVAANATILYDPSVAYFLHIESVIGLGYYLGKRLIRLAER